jgi:hypothetical protein
MNLNRLITAQSTCINGRTSLTWASSLQAPDAYAPFLLQPASARCLLSHFSTPTPSLPSSKIQTQRAPPASCLRSLPGAVEPPPRPLSSFSARGAPAPPHSRRCGHFQQEQAPAARRHPTPRLRGPDLPPARDAALDQPPSPQSRRYSRRPTRYAVQQQIISTLELRFYWIFGLVVWAWDEYLDYISRSWISLLFV